MVFTYNKRMKKMISTSEFATKFGVSTERVRQLCKSGRIKKAQLLTVGQTSVWLIPDDAADPRLKIGRPKNTDSCVRDEISKKKIFKKILVDQKAAHKRLIEGRMDAERIIRTMAEKGVTVELFGSMKVGNPHQYSDIDLLVTDCGTNDPAIAMYEIELLSGDIPVDVTILEYVPKRSLGYVMETLHA